MSHPSKIKGNTYERELVDQAKASGLTAERCWGSDGRSRGLPEEVDIIIEDYFLQCKRRKSIAKYLKVEKADGVVFREDRGQSYILLPFEFWLRTTKLLNEHINEETI